MNTSVNSKEQKNVTLARNSKKEVSDYAEKKAMAAKKPSVNSASSASRQTLHSVVQEVSAVEKTAINLATTSEDDVIRQAWTIDSKIISAYLEILKDKSIPYEQRMEIAKEIDKRRDKMDKWSAETEKERTHRLKTILWQSTLKVLGVAFLSFLPDILKVLFDHYPIKKV